MSRRTSRLSSLSPRLAGLEESAATIGPSAEAVINRETNLNTMHLLESKTAVEEYCAACFSIWDMLVKYSGHKAAIDSFVRNEDIQHRASLSATAARNVAVLKKDQDPFSGDYTELLDGRAAEIVNTIGNVHVPFADDAEASDRDMTLNTQQVMSGNSFIDTEELVYVRVWSCRREGRRFQAALKALSQARQDLLLPATFCVPHSVAVGFQGKLVTVTWLTPLMDEFPIEMSEDSIIGHAEQCVRSALGVPLSAPSIPLFLGGDGRYYFIGISEVFFHRLSPKFAGSTNMQRVEHLAFDGFTERIEAGLRSESNTQHVQTAMKTRLLQTVRRWLRTPELLPESDPDVFSKLFKDCGLNMQFLFEVRTLIVERFQASAKKIGSSANLKALRDVTTEGCDEEAKAKFLALLDEELVCRTVLTMIQASIELGDVSCRENGLANALESANNVLRELKENKLYFKKDVMSVMRTKFNAPPTFVLSHNDYNLHTVCYFVADRLGLAFDEESEAFTGFEEPLPLSHSGRRVLSFEGEDSAIHHTGGRADEWLGFLCCMTAEDPPAHRTTAALLCLTSLNNAATKEYITGDEYTAALDEIVRNRLGLSNGAIAALSAPADALAVAIIGEASPASVLIPREELYLLSRMMSMASEDVAYICERAQYLQAYFRLSEIPLSIPDRARLMKCWSAALHIGFQEFEQSDPLWHARTSASSFLFFSTLASQINKVIQNAKYENIRKIVSSALVVAVGATEFQKTDETQEAVMQATALLLLANFDDLLSEDGHLRDQRALLLGKLLRSFSEAATAVSMGISLLVSRAMRLAGPNDVCAKVDAIRGGLTVVSDGQKVNDQLFALGEEQLPAIGAIRDDVSSRTATEKYIQFNFLADALNNFLSRVEFAKGELKNDANKLGKSLVLPLDKEMWSSTDESLSAHPNDDDIKTPFMKRATQSERSQRSVGTPSFALSRSPAVLGGSRDTNGFSMRSDTNLSFSAASPKNSLHPFGIDTNAAKRAFEGTPQESSWSTSCPPAPVGVPLLDAPRSDNSLTAADDPFGVRPSTAEPDRKELDESTTTAPNNAVDNDAATMAAVGAVEVPGSPLALQRTQMPPPVAKAPSVGVDASTETCAVEGSEAATATEHSPEPSAAQQEAARLHEAEHLSQLHAAFQNVETATSEAKAAKEALEKEREARQHAEEAAQDAAMRSQLLEQEIALLKARDEAERDKVRAEAEKQALVDWEKKANEWSAELSRREEARKAQLLAERQAWEQAMLADQRQRDEGLALRMHLVDREGALRYDLVAEEASARRSLEGELPHSRARALIRESERKEEEERECKRRIELDDERRRRDMAIERALEAEETAVRGRVHALHLKIACDERRIAETTEIEGRRVIWHEYCDSLRDLELAFEKTKLRLHLGFTHRAPPSPTLMIVDSPETAHAARWLNIMRTFIGDEDGFRHTVHTEERHHYSALLEAFRIEALIISDTTEPCYRDQCAAATQTDDQVAAAADLLGSIPIPDPRVPWTSATSHQPLHPRPPQQGRDSTRPATTGSVQAFCAALTPAKPRPDPRVGSRFALFHVSESEKAATRSLIQKLSHVPRPPVGPSDGRYDEDVD